MTILLALTAILAYLSARYEARERLRRIQEGDKEQLPHTAYTVIRCLLWSAIALILCGFGLLDWWGAVKAIPASGALFAIIHRLRFNKGRDWWWMGDRLDYRPNGASRYDAAYHWLAWKLNGSKITPCWYTRTYPKTLPAKLAYGFEGAVVVVSILLNLL